MTPIRFGSKSVIEDAAWTERNRVRWRRGSAQLGVGILGMRERVAQLGGHLQIESNASGTTVKVTIPLSL